jgi:hypothetical protein
MATGSSIRKATLADAPRLAQTLASAFQDDPVITWIFPDQQRRRAVLPAFRSSPSQAGLPHDEVWMTSHGAPTAVWIPPTRTMAATPPPAGARRPFGHAGVDDRALRRRLDGAVPVR